MGGERAEEEGEKKGRREKKEGEREDSNFRIPDVTEAKDDAGKKERTCDKYPRIYLEKGKAS